MQPLSKLDMIMGFQAKIKDYKEDCFAFFSSLLIEFLYHEKFALYE